MCVLAACRTGGVRTGAQRRGGAVDADDEDLGAVGIELGPVRRPVGCGCVLT
jgi:hypothetical protein